MELKEIKHINQNIFNLDRDLAREKKSLFIASLIIAYKLNNNFVDSIDFTKENSLDQIIELIVNNLNAVPLQSNTKESIVNALNTITGANTLLDKNKKEFHEFINNFITDISTIESEPLFFEKLYMEVDKKAKGKNTGIVLTPDFIANLMIDLAKLDYKKDVVLDPCSGTGIFSKLSYFKMKNDLEADKNNLTKKEYAAYQTRLQNSIIANDISAKMITICFANFLLYGLNTELLYCENIHDLKIENIQPTKALLNPPYENQFKPISIIEKATNLVNNKVVTILPAGKFGQNKDAFYNILKKATYETNIKMQDDLFKDSGTSASTSILVFNANKPHNKEDNIYYYDFTDTGYVYLKDSGLVDKSHTFEDKKANLLNRVYNHTIKESGFKRTWGNFYEVDNESELIAHVDPIKVKTDKEEADITWENMKIKKMLKEKEELVESCDNNYVDESGEFENYIISMLREMNRESGEVDIECPICGYVNTININNIK